MPTTRWLIGLTVATAAACGAGTIQPGEMSPMGDAVPGDPIGNSSGDESVLLGDAARPNGDTRSTGDAMQPGDSTLSGDAATGGDSSAPGDASMGGDDDEPTGGDPGPELIFAENFDGHPDWFSTSVGTCANVEWGCSENVPAPWDLMYLDQPSMAELGPTCQISAAGAIGGQGKGIRFIDDSRGRKNAWKADCQLLKYLGSAYPELYVRFDLLWNPDMTLDDFNAAKIFRAGYYLPGYFDGSLTTGVFSTNASTRGLVFIDIKNSGGTADFKAIYRCNPGYKNGCRSPSQSSIGPWDTSIADGQPHTIVFRLKNNTGTQSDGVFQAWWDGSLVIDVQNMQWTTSGANPGGFNSFSVGGNQDHNWGCPGLADSEMCEDESQQWKHNIDNVRLGTTWEAVQ